MLSTIHLGFQRVTCCSVEVSRQASQVQPAESVTIENASRGPNFGRCSWDQELHSDFDGGRGVWNRALSRAEGGAFIASEN